MDYKKTVENILGELSYTRQFGEILSCYATALVLLFATTSAVWARGIKLLSFIKIGVFNIVLNNYLGVIFIEEFLMRLYVLYNFIVMIEGILQDYVRQSNVESKYLKICFVLAFFIVVV